MSAFQNLGSQRIISVANMTMVETQVFDDKVVCSDNGIFSDHVLAKFYKKFSSIHISEIKLSSSN